MASCRNKARFIRRISAVSNAIETIDNEMICLIIFCLNCIRHGRNATYEPGLTSLYSLEEVGVNQNHLCDICVLKFTLSMHLYTKTLTPFPGSPGDENVT